MSLPIGMYRNGYVVCMANGTPLFYINNNNREEAQAIADKGLANLQTTVRAQDPNFVAPKWELRSVSVLTKEEVGL